jgi:uncharacterized protein YjiS (DUF1127 family)
MFSAVTQTGRRLAAWCRQRRASRQLHALDDRMLRDMGIHRSHIDMIVRGVDCPHRRRG